MSRKANCSKIKENSNADEYAASLIRQNPKHNWMSEIEYTTDYLRKVLPFERREGWNEIPRSDYVLKKRNSSILYDRVTVWGDTSTLFRVIKNSVKSGIVPLHLFSLPSFFYNIIKNTYIMIHVSTIICQETGNFAFFPFHNCSSS